LYRGFRVQGSGFRVQGSQVQGSQVRNRSKAILTIHHGQQTTGIFISMFNTAKIEPNDACYYQKKAEYLYQGQRFFEYVFFPLKKERSEATSINIQFAIFNLQFRLSGLRHGRCFCEVAQGFADFFNDFTTARDLMTFDQIIRIVVG